MGMKVSASMQLVMQLAGREAIAGGFGEIRSEHVFNALLKCSELPEEQMRAVAADHAVRDALVTDIADLREELDMRAIDTKAARRTIRQKLGKGGVPFDGGEIHRSTECRKLFDLSARLADKSGEEVLSPAHLLEAFFEGPPDVIAEVLDAIGAGEGRRSRTPVLDAHAIDISASRAEAELPPITGRKGECTALMNALAKQKRHCILAVSEAGTVVRALLLSLMRNPIGGSMPRNLRRMRVMALDSPSATFVDKALSQSIAKELEQDRRTLLLVSIRTPMGKSPEWLAELCNLTRQGKVRCVCDVSPRVYEETFRSQAEWKEVACVMRFAETSMTDIPDEL